MLVKSWFFYLAFFHVVLAGSCSVVQRDISDIARERGKDKGAPPGQCHLEIKCGEDRVAPVRLPIVGPRGPPGQPGIPGARGEPGLPGDPGLPERPSLLGRDSSFSSSSSSSSLEDASVFNAVTGFSANRERRSAFCVGLKENFGPVKENTDIIFDRVLTNVGADYNAATGRYTAPVNGTYEFRVTVSARGKQKAAAMLVKNGFMIAAVWAESIPTWAAASNALILELKQGDQVWLILLHKASHLHGYMYTTFTGNLLFRTGF